MSVLSPHLPLSNPLIRCHDLYSYHRRSHRTVILTSRKCSKAFSEQLACDSADIPSPSISASDGQKLDIETEDTQFRDAHVDLKHFSSPGVEVRELEELPEQWRRVKLAWLCKELPIQSTATLIRLLRAQKKWIRQEDATYIIVHSLRVRQNEAAFKVYKWMIEQHWFLFDFTLATKVADQVGKEGKYAKCREIFDSIIAAGRVPSESTFHILIVAYLSDGDEHCLEEANSIYERMIHLGGYQPRTSLHNTLFKALVSKSGAISKRYLDQAEFIYHNLRSSGIDIHKDIYGGLIWLHSFQISVDSERIKSIREDMKQAGIPESKAVLVSVLRACSKEGEVEEAEKAWVKLLEFGEKVHLPAIICKMEVYAKAGQPMKALEIFRDQQKQQGAASIAYHKIIEILCNAEETSLAESLMQEFMESGLNPLEPSVVDMLNMYLNLSLHDKLESLFLESLKRCTPNRSIYTIYLDFLLRMGNLLKAEETFLFMYSKEELGICARSCNIILRGYLSTGEYPKAEKVYDLMRQKNFDVEPSSAEKLELPLKLTKKKADAPMKLSLNKDQREALVGMLLGGLQIRSDEKRKTHEVLFTFSENTHAHSVLRRRLYEQFREWLHLSCIPKSSDVPVTFSTIPHPCFGIYAEEFWPRGKPMIPKLIHRWLSPQAAAYWFMYAGCRTSSGDILLKLRASGDGVEKIVKAFAVRSIICQVKRKGQYHWIGFFGFHSVTFWNLVEPYIFHELKISPSSRDETLPDEDVSEPVD